MQDKIKAAQNSQYRTLAVAWALMTVAAVVVAAILHAESSAIIVLAVVLVVINFQLVIRALGLSKQPGVQAIGDLFGFIAFVALAILNHVYPPFALYSSPHYDAIFWSGIYILVAITFAFDMVVQLIRLGRTRSLKRKM